MEFGVFLVWGCVGDGKFNKRDPFRVARFFCGQKMEVSLEVGPTGSLLDIMEG